MTRESWIRMAVEQFATEIMLSHPQMAETARELGALPLWFDWTGGVAIRPDCELVGFDWGVSNSGQVETNPHLRFLARVAGAQRYIVLASLAPKRRARDRDCPGCDGTGIVKGLAELGIDPSMVSCHCGGAGWLPCDVAEPVRTE